MKKFLLIACMLVTTLAFSQDLKKLVKFSTFYAAASGGTSISDETVYSVDGILEKGIDRTPYDYSLAFGIRKIARFGYENKASTFYDGSENSWSDGASVGKRSGLEYLLEIDYKRQMGEEFLDQHHFIRYVSDWYILKGEYLEDGFADISYFETSQRYRKKLGSKFSINAGALQRLAEPYGYNPLDEWMLSNGNLHYMQLAINEGYSVDVYANEYKNPDGEIVATSVEVWEAVVIPQVLNDYVEKKRNLLDRKMQQSLVVGFDFYHYKKNIWLHIWGNLMPWHYDDGGSFSYHNYNDGKQWYDYSGGLIFGYKLTKSLGMFVEGKYNRYWNREWYDFKFGMNYVIL